MIRKVTPALSAAARLAVVLPLTCVVPPAAALPQDQTIRPGRAQERPASSLPRTLVLGYDAFGPQVVAHELIGYGWNQWKAEGHQLPDDVEVKVVVYRGLRPGKVRAAYPVVRGRSDYRYVEYGRALRFLDGKIAELEGWKKAERDADSVKTWEDLLATLKNTRAAIIRGLGRST